MDQSGVSQSKSQSDPVCGKEALDLLNCVTQSPYDQDKCLRLLQSLRDCVLNKVPFSLSHCFVMGLWALLLVYNRVQFKL